MLRLLADFNDVHQGSVSGLTRYLTGPDRPRPGARVRVRDGEGEQCEGAIKRMDGDLVYVSLDLSTWVHEVAETIGLTRGLLQVVDLPPSGPGGSDVGEPGAAGGPVMSAITVGDPAELPVLALA